MVVATWLEYTLGGVLGVMVGFLGGFAGIGGAPFIVAGLTLMVGYPQHLAQGTTVAVMLGPMSLPGVLVMWDRVKLLKNYIAIGVCTYAVCSYVGALISYLFNGDAMQMLFGIFISILGIRNVVRGLRAARANKAAEEAAKMNTSSSRALAPEAVQSDDVEMDDQLAGADANADADADEVDIDAASTVADDEAEAEAADEAAAAPAAAAAAAAAAPAKKNDKEVAVAVDGDSADDDAVTKEVVDEHNRMNPEGLTYTGEPPIKFTYVAAAVMGCIVGTVGGLFGIGAGVLMVPIMTSFFHIHKDDARAISLGILCPPVSLGAVIAYQQRGDIRWPMVALQFVAYMSTNRAGALVGKKVKPILFGHVLGSTLGVLGIILVVLAADSCGGFCF